MLLRRGDKIPRHQRRHQELARDTESPEVAAADRARAPRQVRWIYAVLLSWDKNPTAPTPSPLRGALPAAMAAQLWPPLQEASYACVLRCGREMLGEASFLGARVATAACGVRSRQGW